MQQYKFEMSQVDWSPLYSINNIDTANSYLTDKISDVLNRAAPLTRCQYRSHYKHWLSDRTKLAMNERDKSREHARRTKDTEDWNAYKILRNKCIKFQISDKKTLREMILNRSQRIMIQKNFSKKPKKC